MANERKDLQTHAADFIKTDVDDLVLLGNPMMDNVVTSMTAMGAEMWAIWRRVRVLEKILEDKGVTAEMIESYMAPADVEAGWQNERDEFITRAFGPLTREGNKKVSAAWPKKS